MGREISSGSSSFLGSVQARIHRGPESSSLSSSLHVERRTQIAIEGTNDMGMKSSNQSKRSTGIPAGSEPRGILVTWTTCHPHVFKRLRKEQSKQHDTIPSRRYEHF